MKKRPEENKRNRRVFALELDTGILYRFQTLKEASLMTNTSVITIQRNADAVKSGNGYVWCNPGDEQRAIELAEYLRKTGYTKSRRGRPKKTKGKVWLQLDSHTRILVKPEEATPEFAILYKSKIKK